MNKRVLLVYHTNFLNHDVGCNSYVFEMMSMLKSRGCAIDMFSIGDLWNTFDNFDELNKKYRLIDKLYLYMPDRRKPAPRKTAVKEVLHKETFWLFGLPLWVRRITERTEEQIPAMEFDFGWVNADCVEYFQQVVKNTHYDAVNVHYIQMAELIKYTEFDPDTRLIYSAQDASYMMNGFLPSGLDAMMWIMPREIKLMSLFHEVLCISADEKCFFEKLLPQQKFRHFPHSIKARTLPQKEKTIDALFLGFTNPHNVRGVIWFIDNVMPHVRRNVRVTICGKVWTVLDKDHPEHVRKAGELGIRRINYAPDLDELYAETRLSICPLQGGTGMKIKTLDSMARGIPVVTTDWGIDGFADKHDNGCILANEPEAFAAAINDLTENQEHYRQAVDATRKYFERYLSWEANVPVIDAAFRLKG